MKRWLALSVLLALCVGGCASGTGAASKDERSRTFQGNPMSEGHGADGGGGGY